MSDINAIRAREGIETIELMEKQQTDCMTIVIQIHPNSAPNLQFCSTSPSNGFKIISPATKKKILDDQKWQNKTNYHANGRPFRFRKKRQPNRIPTEESEISEWNQQSPTNQLKIAEWNQQPSINAVSPNNWNQKLPEASSILDWNERPLIEK